MLLLPGHGAVATTGTANRTTARTKAGSRILAAHEVCGFATRAEMDAAGPRGRFAYFFPGAAHFPQGPASIARLDALADQMVVPRPGAPTTTTIPRVLTFFGQFIDHDITANTDRDGDLSKIDPEHGGAFVPLARDQVARELENLRAGALNLDSLHGGGPVQGVVAQMFDDALRFPADRAKLWAGTLSHVPGQVVPKPADPADLARDLLRLGRVVSGPHAPLDEAFFRGLPPDARAHFLDAAGHIRPSVAFIADARNDENLVIAQFHLAMLRLHNRIVDHARQDPTAPVRDREALFAWARRQVSWIYQWLVLNAFLPAVCDPAVLREVNRNGPLLYDALIARNRPPAAGLLPLPLEFSAAAFRFGHSMIRGDDDWNRFHGRGGAGAPATLGDLFANTGGAAVPFGGLPHLPSHWPVEWDRFVEGSPARYPDWSAMPIDTSLTPTLGALPGVDAGQSGRMRQLAARNLRRGYLLNLPSAQACIAALQTGFGIAVRPLSRAELTGGPTGGAVVAGGFDRDTPLWFYVLKEAEVIGGGNRLGPLGSRLVADTLVGLVRHDPESYWRQRPPGTWTPRDGIMPDGVTILTMADMMTAARLL